MEQRIVPRDKLVHDALDPAQRQRRGRQRYYAKRQEIIDYTRDGRARTLREKMGK